MKPMLALTIVQGVGLAGGLLAAPLAAWADDCAPLVSAMIAQARTPFAGTMATAKPDKSVDRTASIVTGTKMYIQVNGAWQSMPYTAQDAIDRINKAAKAAKQTCAKGGSEAVDGVATSIFNAHIATAGGVSDNRIWISDKTGLPVKSETQFQNGMTVTQSYRYDNIQPPVGVE